jgi:hypothetical protein
MRKGFNISSIEKDFNHERPKTKKKNLADKKALTPHAMAIGKKVADALIFSFYFASGAQTLYGYFSLAIFPKKL